jgi:hypothetical protein
MGSRPATDFAELLARLTRELSGRDLPFMVIGGQAVLVHGRPRLTEDIDITLAADPSRLGEVQATCTAVGLAALPEDVEGFVHETFVLPARDPTTAVRVDFIFSTTPYERQAIARAVRLDVAGERVPFATAEDLVIHKLFAGRARDWDDAVSVVRRNARDLDWSYLERWAGEFAAVPGREDLPDRLRRLRTESR